MIIVGFVFLLEPALAAERDDVVLNGQIEIFAIHAGQFRFENDVIFVLINIHARTPGTAGDSLVVKTATNVTGEKPIYFFLKIAQIAKRIVTSDAHNLNLLNLRKS